MLLVDSRVDSNSFSFPSKGLTSTMSKPTKLSKNMKIINKDKEVLVSFTSSAITWASRRVIPPFTK